MALSSRTFGATAEIVRGVSLMLIEQGHAPISEFTLPSGRRLDVAAVTTNGMIIGIEIKVSTDDFRSDQKWPEYLEYIDQYYFAVPDGFPLELLPVEHGLIVADRHGGAIIRASQHLAISAPRRKAMLIKFARNAAERLARREHGVTE